MTIAFAIPVYLLGALKFGKNFSPSTLWLSWFTADVSSESYEEAAIAVAGRVTAADSRSLFHLTRPSSKKAWKCKSFALVPVKDEVK